MEIKVEDYLSHDELKDIVIDEVKGAVNYRIKKDTDLDRIISNSAYTTVYRIVDETLGKDLEQMIKEKVIAIMNDFTSFNVFQAPDAWGREPNSAYKHLQKCIASQFPAIEKIVAEKVEPATLLYLKEEIADAVQESILNLFKKS